MEWNKEPPSKVEHGNTIWLWKKDKNDLPEDVWAYKVFWAVDIADNKFEKVLFAQTNPDDEYIKDVKTMGGWWAGPLEIP